MQRARIFACDGTIALTVICTSSTQRASVLPAWSPQTRPNTMKIALPSSSHTPGVREVVMKWITRKDIKALAFGSELGLKIARELISRKPGLGQRVPHAKAVLDA